MVFHFLFEYKYKFSKCHYLENEMCSVPQSVRLENRIFSCLGANMKNYAACEHRMEHSYHPILHEYLSDSAANALLTVLDYSPGQDVFHHQQIVNLVSGFYWFFGVFGFLETWKPETEECI
jgi:hypothetical protein